MHALGSNPLAVLLSPVVLFALIKQGARTLGAEVGRTMVHSRYIWALLVVVLTYTVLRNLPWEPFTLLAP